MMDYTDRHLRYMIRLMSNKAMLYTEMVTSATLIHNDNVDRWLRYSDVEHPAVLQLGGSSMEDLRGAVAKAKPYGYDEINLNCGCPARKNPTTFTWARLTV